MRKGQSSHIHPLHWRQSAGRRAPTATEEHGGQQALAYICSEPHSRLEDSWGLQGVTGGKSPEVGRMERLPERELSPPHLFLF